MELDTLHIVALCLGFVGYILTLDLTMEIKNEKH